MAEQSAFLKAYDDMQKKKGGFNAPVPVAPGFKPQVPQELSAPQVGPTLANEAQLPIEQRTQDGTMIGVPDFNEPYIVPEAAQAFGDVPVNMPSNPLDSNAQISATQDRLPSTPNEIIPRGGVRTRGTGGEQSPMAAARVGGIAESESEFGLLDTFRDVINPSEEQKAANLAAGARTGGVQVLPAEPSTPEGVPAAPEVMGTPESIADLSVNGTDVVTPEAITAAGPVAPQAQAPQGLNSTQAMLQERFGSPTISGIQSAEEGLGLRTDAQGRMIDPNVDLSSFEQASADREARQAARPDFGTAVSDRDRRAARGEGISDADRRDIAKANRQGASAGDVARGDKVAAANGIDRKTGKPLEGGQGVTSALDKARTAKANAETAKIISDINSANDTSNWDDGKKQAMKTQAKELAVWEINELPKLEKNISQLRAVSDALDLGKIKTGGLGDQIPGLSNWARPFFNPDAEVAKQEVSGVIMQTLKETFPGAISDGERKALIDTIFNPQLQPEDNAKLIIGYTDRLSKAMNAKVAQVKHFREFGNLEGYTGITPRDALMSGIPGTGAGGSPIEGDVNYQSDTQNKAQSLLGAQ
jgi:hypothetical protein